MRGTEAVASKAARRAFPGRDNAGIRMAIRSRAKQALRHRNYAAGDCAYNVACLVGLVALDPAGRRGLESVVSAIAAVEEEER